MAKLAVEHWFSGLTTPITSYDPTKTNLGPRMAQQTGGANPTDKYVGPVPMTLARPQEQSTAFGAAHPHVIDWSSTTQWVFYAEHSTASTTRRVGMYEYAKATGVYTWKGFITMNFSGGTNVTARGIRMTYDTYSTGTVAVSTTTVTGSGTAWQTARFAVGGRIGFGSTNPTAISTWYEITAIGSDTSITIGVSAGTISAGTAFVIEELRCVMATTNATTTNGGLYVAKGLNYSTFSNAGTNIALAAATDNVRATFWLADASTVTNITACGIALYDKDSNTQHYALIINGGGGTTARIFKYNLRAALTLASGKDTTSLVLQTGNATTTGNLQQNNNGRLATLSHGPGSGALSLYYVTASRIYRTVESAITAASTTFLTDLMTEVPPGSTTTYAATGAISSIEICNSIDRLLVLTTSRGYLCTYNTVGSQAERILAFDDRQFDISTASSNTTLGLSWSGQIFEAWVENGFAHFMRTTAAVNPANTYNQMISFPLGADWDFTNSTLDRVITPTLSTSGASSYSRLMVANCQMLGNGTFGRPVEPYRVYYRTSGMSDNSGGWSLINDVGDLSAVAASSSIQFMFEFRLVGLTCIPGRIYGISLTYEANDALPSQLQWNLNDSNNSDGTVGFKQVAVFSSMNTMTITYYRSDNDSAVLVQASSSSTNGVFEYWNGSTWVSGLNTNTVGMRRRFRPTAGLPTGVAVYTKLVVV